jgi:hypothetical protein
MLISLEIESFKGIAARQRILLFGANSAGSDAAATLNAFTELRFLLRAPAQ